jgi:hypothetical protein
MVLEEAGVLGGDDGCGECGGNLGQRDGPPGDGVALALGAQPRLSRTDERGRRRVAPPQQDDLRKRDEDESQIEKDEDREKERRIS